MDSHFECFMFETVVVTVESMLVMLHYSNLILELWTFLICSEITQTQRHTSHTHHTHGFKSHFPGKPAIAGWPLDAQSAVILILNVLVIRVTSRTFLLKLLVE